MTLDNVQGMIADAKDYGTTLNNIPDEKKDKARQIISEINQLKNSLHALVGTPEYIDKQAKIADLDIEARRDPQIFAAYDEYLRREQRKEKIIELKQDVQRSENTLVGKLINFLQKKRS